MYVKGKVLTTAYMYTQLYLMTAVIDVVFSIFLGLSHVRTYVFSGILFVTFSVQRLQMLFLRYQRFYKFFLNILRLCLFLRL